jgi:membrane protease subunit HflC
MRAFLVAVLVLGVLATVTSVLGFGPLIVTREGEQKIALLLGDPVAVIREPGVSLALATEIRTYDSRWLHLSSEPKEIQTLDRERLVVDNYVIWRIADPLLFNESFPGVAGGNRSEAEIQIDQQVRAKVREVIGQRTLPDVLQEQRLAILAEITEKSSEALEHFGIALNDVRINRTELPARTEENVYARMRAERDRLARKYRAEGDEQARRIRAEADREAQIVVATARGEAARVRGEGEAESARIYAEAYSEDADFYEFQRGLEAYRKTIGEGTTMVLPPDHEFFRLLQSGGKLP